jgi:hypothetical protein
MHVVFEITKDPDLLAQYYKLREESYREVLLLPEFSGVEENLDRKSDILIARIGRQCLGGIRICGADNMGLLPLEQSADDLSTQMPHLGLDNFGYCQWMRLTLRPDTEISKMHLQKQFCLALTKFSASLGYRYGFCISSKVHHRFYKRLFRQYGYDYWNCENVAIEKEKEGDFDDLEHLLCVIDMHSVKQEELVNEYTELNVTYHLNIQQDTALYYWHGQGEVQSELTQH